MIISVALNGGLKIILLRGLVGREEQTLVIGAGSNASLLPFLRMLLHDFASLSSKLRCVSDSSSDLSPESWGSSPMFKRITLP